MVSGVVYLVKNKPFIHLFLLISSLDLLYGYPKLETFAQAGSREAQLLLGTTLFQGSPKEKQKAVYLLTKAAKQGSGKACYYLGIANWKGIGTSINIDRSYSWFLKAIAGGEKIAIISLAQLFEDQAGVELAAITYKFGYDQLKVNECKLHLQEILDLNPSIDVDALTDRTFLEKSLPASIKTDEIQVNKEDSFSRKIKLSNGSSYQGSSLKGIPHGFGIKKEIDNRVFIGEFLSGNEDGYGTLYSKDGVIIFNGLWEKETHKVNHPNRTL